jgi:di/tricarboxylate transporter
MQDLWHNKKSILVAMLLLVGILIAGHFVKPSFIADSSLAYSGVAVFCFITQYITLCRHNKRLVPKDHEHSH